MAKKASASPKTKGTTKGTTTTIKVAKTARLVKTEPKVSLLMGLQPQIDAISTLMKQLPLNEYGLPKGYYRPDLLPTDFVYPPAPHAQVVDPPEDTDTKALTCVTDPVGGATVLCAGPPIISRYLNTQALTEEEMNLAFVKLNYDGGFPIMVSGEPFWGQLLYEGPEAFTLFQQYLYLPTATGNGARLFGDLCDIINREAQAGSGNGSTPKLTIETLQAYYHLYYWHYRSSAYDLFKFAAHRKQQEIRAVEMHDEHFMFAKGVMDRLKEYMENEETFWDLMTPIAAVNLLKTIVGVQRLSVGLPAGAPQEDGGHSKGQSIEVTMRTIAGKSLQGGGNAILVSSDGGQSILDRALEDEGTLELAQELVIRLNQ